MAGLGDLLLKLRYSRLGKTCNAFIKARFTLVWALARGVALDQRRPHRPLLRPPLVSRLFYFYKLVFKRSEGRALNRKG